MVKRAFTTGYGRPLRYINAGDKDFEDVVVGHGVTETGLFLAVESDYLGPKRCCEAWDYNDPEIKKRWSRRTLEVETDFLEGDLEGEFL